MRVLFITILSLVLITSSSCAMKRYLVEQFQMHKSVLVKSFPVPGTTSSSDHSKETAQSSCTSQSGDITTGMYLQTIFKVLNFKLPWGWMASFMFASWGLLGCWELRKVRLFYRSQRPPLSPVPIYLKLGQLLLYH
ncbi:hypothetical protein AAG747_26950 [Rapidithrix thailandica]|uniref:ATP synthase F0 subunit 8 n=1 Tax=Rapidithrix thailandica TaxID=413964 RepID=A0AAW9S5Q8_9BACT